MFRLERFKYGPYQGHVRYSGCTAGSSGPDDSDYNANQSACGTGIRVWDYYITTSHCVVPSAYGGHYALALSGRSPTVAGGGESGHTSYPAPGG